MQPATQRTKQRSVRFQKQAKSGITTISKHFSDRSANDVKFEVNCPAMDLLTFYRFRPQPFTLSETTIAEIENRADILLERDCFEHLVSRMGVIRDFHGCGLLSDELIAEGLGYLSASEWDKLSSWTGSIYDCAVGGLVQKVMDEVSTVIAALPYGERLQKELEKHVLYGFYIDETGGNPELRYTDIDFFSHYDAEIERLECDEFGGQLKELFVKTISKLISIGDGVWQNDIQAFGRWDFTTPTKDELHEIEHFSDDLQSVDVSQVAEFLIGYQSKAVTGFLESIEETYYSSLDDIIESEDDGEFEGFKESVQEGVKFLRAEYLSKELGISAKVASWDELEQMATKLTSTTANGYLSDTAHLLDSLIKQRPLSVDGNLPSEDVRCDVFSAVEETCPGLGLIICPFEDESDAGKALRVLSDEMYQQFMESGEGNDLWVINTKNTAWLDAVISRTTATAMLLALIIGHTVVFKESE